MTKEEKLAKLEEVFELDAGALKEDMELASVEAWDSMTKLSLIVLFDDEFGKKLSGQQLDEFVKVSDILDIMQ
ncbi:MAG: acyl carrier protein [Synergistes sp.]|nr:acyl carrier protein [Synergistes sp.]MCR5335241.1 acyl carrier protein [Synergistes sp.]